MESVCGWESGMVVVVVEVALVDIASLLRLMRWR